MTTAKKTQRTLFALAGTGALMGYLLVSGAAAPLIADAVGLVQGPAEQVSASSSNDTTVNGERIALSDSSTFDASNDPWMTNDGRQEWSSSRDVPQGPTGSDAPSKPSDPQRPTIQVPEDPKGRQLFNQAAPMRRYDLKPRGACPQSYGKGLYVQHFSALPGSAAGTATVSWWDLGDPNATEYQIDAVSVSDSGSVTTKTIAAPKSCKDVSLTFTGLKSGTSYVFMLTATDVSPEQENHEYRVGRGQTDVIVTT